MTDQPTAIVIDDNSVQLALNTRMMQNAGYHVTQYTNVDDAFLAMGGTLEAGQITHPVDPQKLPTVVVSDNDTATAMSGIDLAASLKGTPCGIVVVTGDLLMQNDKHTALNMRNPVAVHFDKAKDKAVRMSEFAQRAIDQAAAVYEQMHKEEPAAPAKTAFILGTSPYGTQQFAMTLGEHQWNVTGTTNDPQVLRDTLLSHSNPDLVMHKPDCIFISEAARSTPAIQDMLETLKGATSVAFFSETPAPTLAAEPRQQEPLRARSGKSV